MSTESLQEYVFVSRYSRYRPDKRRRETYPEAVDRVLDMHRRHFAEKDVSIDDLLMEIRPLMLERRVLGSQRALQFGGPPILAKNARIYNCTASYCDRPRFFQEALWLLLCGCGVGFSVQRHHVACLPEIAVPSKAPRPFVVPDSIEGWAEALGVLLSGYFCTAAPVPEFADTAVEFDFSNIRPRGSRLSSGVGRAPGPEPLKRSLQKVRELLDRCVAAKQSRLRSVDAYDIVMHASDAVLAGGVRRSAAICLFTPDDTDMSAAKTGNWFSENPQRARSNNSAMLLRSHADRDEFQSLVQQVKEYGEPGFVWADDTETVYNPCVEIGLYPQIDGESGWAFCNLTEINMKVAAGKEDFEAAARAAAILGTLQADYTRFDYLGEASERIARREALIGVSMTGMMDNPAIAFDPDIQQQGARRVLETNAEVAARVGLNPAARTTCVKPAGTTSSMLGTSSGIHPHYAPRYFRRAQAGENEPVVSFFRRKNPLAVEKSVWNPNGTDVVLTFCIEADPHAKTRRDLGALDMLEYVRFTKKHWVDTGKRPDRCARPWLSHNVSNTVVVRPEEWDDVADYIHEHRDAFAGVALLPDGCDVDYPQAPFCEVLTAREIVDEYGVGAIMASGLIVDGMHAFDDQLWNACDAVLGRDDDNAAGNDPARRDWLRRARKFARNYFDNDLLSMTRCLKRVHNCKLWEDLQREFRHVDYTQLKEEEDTTSVDQAVACSGNECEIL